MTGSYYSLKLLQLVDRASDNSNTVFSPLALKLTLLGLASMSEPGQEDAVNRFLFGHSEPSVLAESFDETEMIQLEQKINLTEEFTKSHSHKGE